MAQHQGETFTNETVVLDGNDYLNCTFTNCEIVFRGTASVSLHGINFNDCRWTFDGPAGLTINFMTALYQAGVTELIDGTFENIRRGVVQPPVPKSSRDELVLKAYSIWLADPDEASRLFRGEELRHEEQLAHYEELEAWMEGEWGEDLTRPDNARFATHAALRRGIIYERGSAEWCRWVAKSIEGEQAV